MKKFTLILLLAFCFAIFSTNGFSQNNRFVSVKGKNYLDPAGKPLLLKGINLGNWMVPEGYMFRFEKTNSPKMIYDLFNMLVGEDEAQKFWDAFRDNYITRDDIHFIKSCGFNSVRIPFNFRLFCDEGAGNKLEGPGYALLDRAIKWCKEEKLYVILDMHCAPGGQTGDNIDDSYGYPFLFESERAKQLTADIWKKLAGIYKNEPTVIGYDVLNEPIATYFDSKKLNPYLEPLYKRVTKAIREVDKNHIIFLGGAQWDSNFDIFGEPFDSKLAYTFHKYWTDPTQKVVQSYIDFSNKYNVPLWMGESGENTNEWINSFRSMLEQNNIGWCFWPYKKMGSDRCIASINQPDLFSLVIEFSKNDHYNFAAIRKNRPDVEKVKVALAQYLENCKFKNCTINEGYLKALGLK